jgi:hypothetical protein
MSEVRLEKLLRLTPDEGEVEFRASRARGAALGRLNAPAAAWRVPRWRPALALAVLTVTAMAILAPSSPNASAPKAAESAEPLRVEMTLSDGTRVHWTFRSDFQL